eukprot:3377104-Alexandrium_andersonii.AAC.1
MRISPDEDLWKGIMNLINGVLDGAYRCESCTRARAHLATLQGAHPVSYTHLTLPTICSV